MADEPSNLSYLVLRRCVGGVGIGLPVSLITAGMLSQRIEPSMSGFYYTGMQDVFVASNCIVGFFLIAYGGYDKQPDEWFSDRTLGIFTGMGAILLALVPTSPIANSTASQDFFSNIHLAGATVFLIGLGTFSFFKFSRTTGPHKNTYRFLGLIIYGAVAVIGIGKIALPKPPATVEPGDWVFWLEVLAVLAFGLSWLIKGKTMEGVHNVRSKMFGTATSVR